MTFKGHTVTPERIDAMEDAEIEELHARHEARLGAAMSKSLGSSRLHMYASMASMLLPLPPSRQLQLVADLEQDRSSVVLFRLPAVSYTTATECS